ncbi:MAG TPA: vanadium-dependent haloperoxidase, partial [Methylomirabilota bacterium]|nr:vanadium-dependent haloperoxidase [Methylomirabilota bacterium]
IQADRTNDATNVPDTYRPITAPGVWIPTTPPLFSEYARAKGWVMQSADQFRPGPPPALSSALYARDYNEVKDLGGVKSVKRTPAQTEAVRFWSQANFTPSWNQAARELSASKGLGLADNARLFALLNMGIANVFIADWDAKFHYNLWRPVTAIRNGDQDGNDATERDAGWSPLNATPMHPEYPSAAAIVSGVGAAILESVFGTGPLPFTITDYANPSVTRAFGSAAQMAEEQREVRVWGGIHYRTSLVVSDEMGRKIAAYLVANTMKPAR